MCVYIYILQVNYVTVQCLVPWASMFMELSLKGHLYLCIEMGDKVFHLLSRTSELPWCHHRTLDVWGGSLPLKANVLEKG